MQLQSRFHSVRSIGVVHSATFLRTLAGAAALAMSAVASAQCTGFNVTPSSGGAIVPGTVDVGNHCDDCTTGITLPFPVVLYGAPYTAAVVSSNGNIQFTTNSTAYSNACLPQSATLGVAIIPHWDDLRTDGVNEGIFTSVTGVAPNRVFNIEWRTHYYSGGGLANFEARLFEDNSHLEVVFGAVDQTGTSATVGVEHTNAPATQYSCNTTGLTPGTLLTFTCTNDPVPPTGTGAATPSNVQVCGTGGVTLLTVSVIPGFNPTSTGLAVTGNLSTIGGSGSQAFYDDGTHGDAAAGDSTFSYQATIPTSVATGTKVVPFVVSDAQGRSTSQNIALQVTSCPVSGPDVFVARLTDVGYYGSSGNITAYSIGTDACNQGDTPVTWIAGNNQHPVIAQNMYRLMNGRFEQIGQSWLKHGFSSTNSGTCGTCNQPPMGSQQLGVACSDAYGSGLNGSQGGLGPRSEVNPTTGVYTYPFTTGNTSTVIGVRLQVKTDDVTPALNPGAQYFGECHYVTSDDAQWSVGGAPAINGLNNVTYQPISIPNATTVPTLTGVVHRQSPAIQAWKDTDPSVTLSHADYVDTSLPGAGIMARFWVGAKATNNGNGTWHYEYAVYNLNSDRAGGAFSVPVGPGVTVSNIGFHGSFAHSGEPYPNTALNMDNWAGSVSGGTVRWTTPEAYLPPSGNNANALRWGTMYNFRFDANIAPANGDATIDLFKPGTPVSVVATSLPVPGVTCDSIDFNNDGLFPDTADIDDFLSVFSGGPCSTGSCGDIDFNNDGLFPDTMDIDSLLTVFSGGGCV